MATVNFNIYQFIIIFGQSYYHWPYHKSVNYAKQRSSLFTQ